MANTKQAGKRARQAVKHRAHEPPATARLTPERDGGARIDFATPQHGVAPGQACVFYDGTRVMGGGWIEQAPPLADA